MNTITITPDTLVIEPHGIDRLWSLKRRIQIPLTEVLGAAIDPSVMNEPKGIPAPGLSFFGRYSGTYMRAGERSFWSVSPGAGDAIVVVTLTGEYYTRLVLSVEHPEQVVRDINRVLIG